MNMDNMVIKRILRNLDNNITIKVNTVITNVEKCMYLFLEVK
jgi:hypothetical protein